MINRLTNPVFTKPLVAMIFAGSLSLSACSFGGQSATALPTVPAALLTGPTNDLTNVPSTAAVVPTIVKATIAPTTIPSLIPPTEAKTAMPATETVAITTNVPAIAANSNNGGSPRVLAWGKDTKQLAWYSAAGTQPVLSGVAQFTMLCSATPVWPTNDRAIVYHGGATTTLQLISLIDPAAPPAMLADGSAIGCDLAGRTAYSPDGKRLALLKYTSDTSTSTSFGAGTFNLVSIPDGAIVGSVDNVDAFALENSGALLVHLIPNSKNQADQADLGWWDATANKERILERGIKSSDKCFFISASVVHVADKVYTAFGENCTAPAGSAYRILRTDFAGGNSSNWVPHTGVGGNYFSYTNTNYLTVLPDNQTLLLAVPNGLKSRIANLLRINISDATVTPLIQSVIMDASPQNGARRFLFNAQGTLLAFVVINTNNGETLYAYDLTKPNQAPAQVTDATRSNAITGLAWNASGDRLIYTVIGDDSSLSYFDLTAGKNLVTRGTFQGLALSSDGQTVATVEQIKQTPTDVRYNLVAIAMTDGTKTLLVTGDKGASGLDVLALR